MEGFQLILRSPTSVHNLTPSQPTTVERGLVLIRKGPSVYKVTKTFGNDLGYSCCFRQWRATHSHCSLLHGYSLGFRLIIEAETLDARNWVYDFGGFKEIRRFLEEYFDHTLAISSDDPLLETFKDLEKLNVARLKIFDGVGCEKFSEFVFNACQILIDDPSRGVRLMSVEAFEHGANSATYSRP